jgi:plasminogen activator inhibitor 1 RNA-binding protein
VADKPLNRSSKRNAPDVAPGAKGHEAPATGGSRRGGAGGSEGGMEQLSSMRQDISIAQYAENSLAYRDRNAGSSSNRGKPTDDGVRQDRHPHRATEGGRGGRGRDGRGRGRGRGEDRHSQSGKT